MWWWSIIECNSPLRPLTTDVYGCPLNVTSHLISSHLLRLNNKQNCAAQPSRAGEDTCFNSYFIPSWINVRHHHRWWRRCCPTHSLPGERMNVHCHHFPFHAIIYVVHLSVYTDWLCTASASASASLKSWLCRQQISFSLYYMMGCNREKIEKKMKARSCKS